MPEQTHDVCESARCAHCGQDVVLHSADAVEWGKGTQQYLHALCARLDVSSACRGVGTLRRRLAEKEPYSGEKQLIHQA